MWPQHPSYNAARLGYFQKIRRSSLNYLRKFKNIKKIGKGILLKIAQGLGVEEKLYKYLPDARDQLQSAGIWTRLTSCSGNWKDCAWDWYNFCFLLALILWIVFLIYQGIPYVRCYREKIMRRMRVARAMASQRAPFIPQS